jgi:type II secretory pathway pseudopilin PulG
MKKSFFLHRSRSGITLIEVLVSVFVIGIGLLGVMAVIPFGAYQVSKAEQAKYTANMLANAAETLKIRGLAHPANWGIIDALSSAETPIYPATDKKLNCSKILWIEPYKMTDPAEHIFRIGALFSPQDGTDNWKEWMRGQDDLGYKIDETTNRPAVKKVNNGIIEYLDLKSTGRYTWFFTYQPKATESNYISGLTDKYEATVGVDILGCYNRIPGDDQQVEVTDFTPTLNGGVLTLKDDKAEELSQTKYILVTWDGTPPGSAWCKVLFAKEKNVMVTGALANFDSATNRQVYITNGVLYHKQVQGVKIKD